MNYIERFRVKPDSKVDLRKVDAGFTDTHESHQAALPEIEAHAQKLHDLPVPDVCRRQALFAHLPPGA